MPSTAPDPWEPPVAGRGWQRGINVLRLHTQRQIPELTRPRSIPPVGRMVRVTAAAVRALGGWAARERRAGGSASRAGLSRRLRLAAEDLGPTYVKLCQILSSGAGLFPEELVEEMSRCRDQVRPVPAADIERVLREELGRPIDEVFRSFCDEPIAAASIAQVHAATLLDGTEVVVKLQRPGIRRQVTRDLRVMATIAPVLVGRIPIAALANPPALVELFASTICEELDFRLEAENMLDVTAVFAELGQDGYVIPRPHPELVTRRMLVMERLHGFAFDDVAGMTEAGIDTTEVIRTGMRGFSEGCMIHGIFHGDLHGGNLLVLPDGRIGLLDFGICARMTPVERTAFLRLAMSGAVGDVAGQLGALRDLGALPADVDLDEVMVDLGLDGPPIDPTTLSQHELVEELQRILKSLLGYGARLPKILMLYVKNLIFLDGAISTLAPDLDLIAEFSNLSMHLAAKLGPELAAQVGVDQGSFVADPDAIKAGFGIVDPDVQAVTYADLRDRREKIRQRLRSRE